MLPSVMSLACVFISLPRKISALSFPINDCSGSSKVQQAGFLPPYAPAAPQFQHADLPDQYRLPLKIEIRLLKIILLHFRLLYRIICSSFHVSRTRTLSSSTSILSHSDCLFNQRSCDEPQQPSSKIPTRHLPLYICWKWCTQKGISRLWPMPYTLSFIWFVYLLANFFFFSFLANRFI